VLLPETVGVAGEVTVRAWRPADVGELLEARRASAAHLAPWLGWANAPVPSETEQLLQLAAWQTTRLRGGDAIYGTFLKGRAVGGCGLHHNLGPNGLEIGYWVHVDFTRRGIASQAASLLTHTAFADDQISVVEIHHDRANAASGGVPRGLGFTFLGEFPDEPQAPGETGVECRWQMTRERWSAA
jgi:ribosomal-protein-serine acetyltransferase